MLVKPTEKAPPGSLFQPLRSPSIRKRLMLLASVLPLLIPRGVLMPTLECLLVCVKSRVCHFGCKAERATTQGVDRGIGCSAASL